MSGLLIASHSKWLVPWANELMLLKPFHPKNKMNGSSNSSVISYITVCFGGTKDGSPIDPDASWKLGIVHRGKLNENTIYNNLEYCNDSLSCPDKSNKKYSFINRVLSSIPEKRKVSGITGSTPMVEVYHEDCEKKEQVFNVLTLNRKNVTVRYLESMDCTIINIEGKGPESQIFRISYEHLSPVLPVAKDLKYSVNDMTFPSEQEFQIFSYQRVLRELKEHTQKTNKEKAQQEFATEIQKMLIEPQTLNLDLTIVGEPTAFRYEFLDSHLTTIDTFVNRVQYFNFNGSTEEPPHALTYSFFPKRDSRNSTKGFEIHVLARLACNICNRYILQKERDEYQKERGEYQKERNEYQKERKKYQKVITVLDKERKQYRELFDSFIKQFHEKFDNDKTS